MMTFSNKTRWCFGIALALMFLVVPFFFYRYTYTYGKRLRTVERGRVYRSGQLTAPGLIEAVDTLGIHTIINLQEEALDPDVSLDYVGSGSIKESELCRQLGVQYKTIELDLLPPAQSVDTPPRALAEYLEIMDNPDNYPVLIHCRAGLHRTGCLCAVYRMEYQGWSAYHALAEMRALGFGRFKCSAANEYIMQYVLQYQPRRAATAQAELPR